MITREFTPAELGALGVPPDSPDDVDGDVILDDQKIMTLKYTQERACVFRDVEGNGRAYTVTYEARLDMGDFEVGDDGPENHGWRSDTVTAYEVEQVPVVVNVWRIVAPHHNNPDELPNPSAVQRLVDLYEETGAHPDDARQWAAEILAQHAEEIGAELPCAHEAWKTVSEYVNDGQRFQTRRCADCADMLPPLPISPDQRPSFRDAAGRTGYEGDTAGGTTSGRYQATLLGPVVKIGQRQVKIRTTISAGGVRPRIGDEVWISMDRVFLVSAPGAGR